MSDDLDRVDCLRFPGDAADEVRVVPAGMGDRIVDAHRREARRRRRVSYTTVGVVTLLTAVASYLLLGVTVTSVAGTGLVALLLGYAAYRGNDSTLAPELVAADVPVDEARDRYTVTVASADPIAAGQEDGEPRP